MADGATEEMHDFCNENEPSRCVEKVRPLEGGWGWMVVFGAGLTLMIIFGFERGFTLIHQKLLLRYGASEADTALVYSLYTGCLYLAGLVTSILCKTVSLRKVMILSAICTCTGVISSAWAASLVGVYITLGILAGFGIGISDVIAYTIICQYFEKRRGLALGVATMGIDIGGLSITPLMAFTWEIYEYSGGMLIVGSLFLHMFVSAGLYRSLHDNYSSKRKSHQIQLKTLNKENGKQLCKIKEKNPYEDVTSQKPDQLEETLFLSSSDKAENKSTANSNGCRNNISLLWISFCEKLGLPLLGNAIFVMFIVQVTGVTFARSFQFVFLAGLAIEKGLSKEEVVGMLMIFSAINCLTRLISGFIFDRSFVRPHVIPVHAMVGIAFCATMYCVTYVKDRVILYISWAAMDALLSIHHTQITNALSHVVGLENVTSAIGLLRIFQGICSIISPIIGGYMRDVAGNYYLGYLCGASVCLVSVITFLLVFCYQQVRKKVIHVGQQEYT